MSPVRLATVSRLGIALLSWRVFVGLAVGRVALVARDRRLGVYVVRADLAICCGSNTGCAAGASRRRRT